MSILSPVFYQVLLGNNFSFMPLSIAHLGPLGTYSEEAALNYAQLLERKTHQTIFLRSYSSISQTLKATAEGETDFAVVPVENSIEGSVNVTLDTLWQLEKLQIQHGLVLPITHALISQARSLDSIKTIYSHPQALGQCQKWLEIFLPQVKIIPTNATTEALQYVKENSTIGAIASQRAARLYELPVLSCPIQDYRDNSTRFWVLSQNPSFTGTHTSLAFSISSNLPGTLTKSLHIFAKRNINLSRIESRPSKRLLGEYIFFIDLEADMSNLSVQSALEELATCTEILKPFGSYTTLIASHEKKMTQGSQLTTVWKKSTVINLNRSYHIPPKSNISISKQNPQRIKPISSRTHID